MGSHAVSEALLETTLEDYSRYYKFLLDIQYPFVVLAGEFDILDGAKA